MRSKTHTGALAEALQLAEDWERIATENRATAERLTETCEKLLAEVDRLKGDVAWATKQAGLSQFEVILRTRLSLGKRGVGRPSKAREYGKLLARIELMGSITDASACEQMVREDCAKEGKSFARNVHRVAPLREKVKSARKFFKKHGE